MATAKVKIGVAPGNFAGIAVLASNVITGLTTNIAFFPLPNPPVAALVTALADLNGAIAVWGPVGNRGSHADYSDLVQKAATMRNMLILESDYVENLVNIGDPYLVQAAFIALSGFGVKNLPTPQGVLGPPIGLFRLMNNDISEDDICLRWYKPIGLNSPNNVKSYVVKELGGLIADTIVTKTQLLFTPVLPHGTIFRFIVDGFNDTGYSPDSNILTVHF